MDDNREKEQSPNLIETAQNLQRTAGLLARGVRLARTAGAFLASIEFLAPAVAIGAGLFVFILILGGPGAASETPVGQETQRPTGLFNIKGASSEETAEINGILSSSLSSQTYSSLLASAGPIEITIESGGCSGLVDRGTVTLYNFSSCGDNFKRYLVLHEMGHIIHARNGRLAQTFNHNEYIRLDPSCYDSEGYLLTYPKPEGKANAFNESFAEAIALFQIYNERPPLNSFPNQCPNTYNWVRDNIFR